MIKRDQFGGKVDQGEAEAWEAVKQCQVVNEGLTRRNNFLEYALVISVMANFWMGFLGK